MSDGTPAIFPQLERGLIVIVWFSTDLAPGRFEPLEHLLDGAERQRAARFRFERDRRRFVAARARLRTLLGGYAGVSPERLTIEVGPYGKPALGHVGRESQLQFSLSHSHGAGVIAVGLEDDIGIDIERLRPIDDALAIADRLFTAEEFQALRALHEPARSATFFKYWTGKEAVVKSIGRGLSQPLDGFGLRLDRPGAERVEVDCGGVRVARWVLSVPPLREEYVLTVAAGGGAPQVRSQEWSEA